MGLEDDSLGNRSSSINDDSSLDLDMMLMYSLRADHSAGNNGNGEISSGLARGLRGSSSGGGGGDEDEHEDEDEEAMIQRAMQLSLLTASAEASAHASAIITNTNAAATGGTEGDALKGPVEVEENNKTNVTSSSASHEQNDGGSDP